MWYNNIRNFFLILGSSLLLFTVSVTVFPNTIYDVALTPGLLSSLETFLSTHFTYVLDLFYAIVILLAVLVGYVLLRLLALSKNLTVRVDDLSRLQLELNASAVGLSQSHLRLRDIVCNLSPEVARLSQELRASTSSSELKRAPVQEDTLKDLRALHILDQLVARIMDILPSLERNLKNNSTTLQNLQQTSGQQTNYVKDLLVESKQLKEVLRKVSALQENYTSRLVSNRTVTTLLSKFQIIEQLAQDVRTSLRSDLWDDAMKGLGSKRTLIERTIQTLTDQIAKNSSMVSQSTVSSTLPLQEGTPAAVDSVATSSRS